MRFKKFLYSVLLLLFVLVLIADLGLWFLVPDAQAASETGTLPAGMNLPEGVTLPEGMTFPSDGSFPEGMTRPEGVTVPEGGSFPQGMTRPEGGSVPEGFTFPGAGSGSEGSSRPSRPNRPSRTETGTETAEGTTPETAAATETEESAEDAAWRAWLAAKAVAFRTWVSARVKELQAALPLSELTPVKEQVAPYRLHILIGAAVGMLLCIVRLIFINRKLRKQREAEEAANPLSVRPVALWPAFLLFLAALGLVVFLFPVNEEEKTTDGAVTNSRVLSGTVGEQDLTSLIQSTGSLEEQEAVTLEIPASITVESVCVKNGDLVTAGQILAKADSTSVMKAVASVHEALNQIDSQLQEAHEAKGDTSLTSPVAGTVKVVYAQVGQTAMDVMSEHGALMLLSLDGRMAVKIPAGDLSMGTGMTVTLPDGTEIVGEVAFLEEGVATVTVVDRGYDIGTEVSVKDKAGTLLGSGSLYVHKSLNITGYLGTVVRIYRGEGRTVEAGASVIGLSNTADLADYRSLLQRRADYEAELKTLFEIYEDGYIHAPCAGVVDGLSDDLTYAALSDMVAGLTVRRLASGPADAEPSDYVHYIGRVQDVSGGVLYLEVSSSPVTVNSYTSLPSIPSSTMTGTYTIPGSVPIYLFSGGWNTISVSDIRVGDKILFTFDQTGTLVWVIVAHGAATPTPTITPTPTPTPTPSGSQDPNQTPTPSGSPGPQPSGGHGPHISFNRGGVPSATQKPAYVIAKEEFCTVTPQERMLITVPIDELDVLALSLGQEADLYLDALPTTGLKATVTKIDPEGENSGGNTKYSVTLSLDRGAQLYPGMNGTVCFPRRTGTGAPTVPLAALVEEGNKTLIYTAYNEETDQLLSPVEVKTGLSDGTDVEILSGLAPGDTYYYRYADAISYVTE